MLLNTYELAATLTVGTDALRNARQNVSSRNRVLRGLAIVGANAINECAVDLYIEDYYVGQFRNSRAGVVQVVSSDDIYPVGPFAIPSGSKLTAIIAVAPTVSPVTIQLY